LIHTDLSTIPDRVARTCRRVATADHIHRLFHTCAGTLRCCASSAPTAGSFVNRWPRHVATEKRTEASVWHLIPSLPLFGACVTHAALCSGPKTSLRDLRRASRSRRVTPLRLRTQSSSMIPRRRRGGSTWARFVGC
jgi:hypothetical protein